MLQYIEVKSILSKLRQQDSFFGIAYNMNIYRGCQHGCIYCDTRSECYGVGDISKIAVKKKYLELLTQELSSKRKNRGTIGTGSMNDPYMPVERELQFIRKALMEIARQRFPVHIITKSDLVTRDTDIIKEISRIYAAVSITITTPHDTLSKRIEPNAPLSSHRFKVLEHLAKNGIYTGVTLMPVLPYITDKKEDIITLVKKAKDAGASYIIPMFGTTMRKGSRDYYYNMLEKEFPGLREQYEINYRDSYECFSPHYKSLNEVFSKFINELNISSRMQFYDPVVNEQLSLF